jgi:hypothetical protein
MYMLTSDGRPLAPPFQSVVTFVGEAARAGVTENKPRAVTNEATRPEWFRRISQHPQLIFARVCAFSRG